MTEESGWEQLAAGTSPLPGVLHLVTDLRVGGTQGILLERVRARGPFRHAVLCFATRTGASAGSGGAEMTAEFARAGVPVFSLDLRRPREVPRALLRGRLARRVDAVLRETAPSLVHSTLYHTHLLGGWVARRAGLPHLASKEGIDDWMSPFQRSLEARSLRGADRVVAVSEATARVARSLGVRPERVLVIPNGVDPGRPGDWQVPAGRRPGGPHLLGVGRLDPVKGWDDLLDAMVLLRRTHPGLCLDLLGSGTTVERRRLEASATARGLADRVRLGDGRTEAGNGADPATILVVPSREEGFGLVLLEGMARGLPIVATTAGGIPDVARADREALLVPPRDARALAEAIDRLYRDPVLRETLVNHGRERVAAFPVAGMVNAYHRLYAAMVGSSAEEAAGPAPAPGIPS